MAGYNAKPTHATILSTNLASGSIQEFDMDHSQIQSEQSIERRGNKPNFIMT